MNYGVLEKNQVFNIVGEKNAPVAKRTSKFLFSYKLSSSFSGLLLLTTERRPEAILGYE